MNINDTKQKNFEKIIKRGYTCKITYHKAVYKPRMLKVNAMEKKYHPCVWYKNNLIFNLMNINENFRNRREKKKTLNGLTYKLPCISATKSTKVLKMASNDC